MVGRIAGAAQGAGEQSSMFSWLRADGDATDQDLWERYGNGLRLGL